MAAGSWQLADGHSPEASNPKATDFQATKPFGTYRQLERIAFGLNRLVLDAVADVRVVGVDYLQHAHHLPRFWKPMGILE